MNVFFISDLHLGHAGILKFSPMRGGTTIEEHDQWIVDSWNSKVSKKDLVYILGDVSFGVQNLTPLLRMKGQKVLIRGNHDEGPVQEYTRYFTNVYGVYKRYGIWMSHAPIHPDELRGKPNIHGHVHQNSIPDPRYFNACVEPLGGVPISLEEVRKELIGRGVLDISSK